MVVSEYVSGYPTPRPTPPVASPSRPASRPPRSSRRKTRRKLLESHQGGWRGHAAVLSASNHEAHSLFRGRRHTARNALPSSPLWTNRFLPKPPSSSQVLAPVKTLSSSLSLTSPTRRRETRRGPWQQPRGLRGRPRPSRGAAAQTIGKISPDLLWGTRVSKRPCV